jgi:hypothetical protein
MSPGIEAWRPAATQKLQRALSSLDAVSFERFTSNWTWLESGRANLQGSIFAIARAEDSDESASRGALDLVMKAQLALLSIDDPRMTAMLGYADVVLSAVLLDLQAQQRVVASSAQRTS